MLGPSQCSFLALLLQYFQHHLLPGAGVAGSSGQPCDRLVRPAALFDFNKDFFGLRNLLYISQMMESSLLSRTPEPLQLFEEVQQFLENPLFFLFFFFTVFDAYGC